MVPGELPHLAGEARRSVGEEDLDLREPTRVEQELAGRRIARCVFGADPEVELPAERNPRRLAAPARLHELVLEREQTTQRRNSLGRLLLLEPCREAEIADCDPEHRRSLPWSGPR